MNMSKYKIMSFEVEKNEILDKTFQVILTIKIEIIMNNEIKKLSRNINEGLNGELKGMMI